MQENKETNTFFKFGIYTHQEIITGNVPELGLKDLFTGKRRNHYLVLIAGANGCDHFVDNKPIQVAPYTNLFIGPDRLTHFEKEVSEDTYIITFSSLFYSRTARDAFFLQNSKLFHNYGSIYTHQFGPHHLEFIKIMREYLIESKKKSNSEIHTDLAHNVIQQTLLVGTINSEEKSYFNFLEDKENILVLNFRTSLNEHFKKEKSVQFYADLLNITERRLNKATKEILNLSAKEVISKKVMEEAKWQLIYSQDSIKEISLELGFFEEHNFSSFFLKNEGMRPKQFRTTYKTI